MVEFFINLFTVSSFLYAVVVLIMAPLAVFQGWLPKKRFTVGPAVLVSCLMGAIMGVLSRPHRVPVGLWWHSELSCSMLFLSC